MDIKKFLASWNGLLMIMFIGIYLMLPAIRIFVGAYDSGKGPEVNQIQLFVGGVAVIWALRGFSGKLRGKKDE